MSLGVYISEHVSGGRVIKTYILGTGGGEWACALVNKTMLIKSTDFAMHAAITRVHIVEVKMQILDCMMGLRVRGMLRSFT